MSIPADYNNRVYAGVLGKLIGVYLGRPQGLDAALYDLESIEVLKGPQGTLFGRNTEAGALNITTKKPTGRFDLSVTAGVGNYGSHEGEIHLDLPDSEVARRVLARRLCAGCGMDYSLIDNSPSSDGRCDACGGELIRREDDTEEALAVRLREYHQKTNPVLEIFRRKEYVITVDSRPGKQLVQQAIRNSLGLLPSAVGGEQSR